MRTFYRRKIGRRSGRGLFIWIWRETVRRQARRYGLSPEGASFRRLRSNGRRQPRGGTHRSAVRVSVEAPLGTSPHRSGWAGDENSSSVFDFLGNFFVEGRAGTGIFAAVAASRRHPAKSARQD